MGSFIYQDWSPIHEIWERHWLAKHPDDNSKVVNGLG